MFNKARHEVVARNWGRVSHPYAQGVSLPRAARALEWWGVNFWPSHPVGAARGRLTPSRPLASWPTTPCRAPATPLGLVTYVERFRSIDVTILGHVTPTRHNGPIKALVDACQQQLPAGRCSINNSSRTTLNPGRLAPARDVSLV